MFKKIIRKSKSHKITTVIIIILIVIVAYFIVKAVKGDSDVVMINATAMVEKGTIVVSITGSGQVSAVDHVDIKPKVSGEITQVNVENGQTIWHNALMFQIDPTDATRDVRDAETALQTAKLELDELLEPPDELTLLQSEHSLIQANESIQKSEDSLAKSYEDAFNSVANVFLNLPATVTDLYNILYSNEIADSQSGLGTVWNISALVNSVSHNDYNSKVELGELITLAENSYKLTETKHDESFVNYQTVNRYSDIDVIEKLLAEALETAKNTSDTIKIVSHLLDYWVDYRVDEGLRIFNKVSEYQANLKSYTSKTNSNVSALLSAEKSIKDSRDSLAAAHRTIKERELSLKKLKDGANELSIRAKNIAIQQRYDALTTAKDNLSDHFISAPFTGLVSGVTVKRGDSVSSNTTLASIITKQKIVEITLNEIDISKIEIKQKATITFDAIDDITITGEVVEVDVIGGVSQGVVTYNVKIALDTQDERIKPGMSTTAAIVVGIAQNVLLVPNSAIKQQGDRAYVEVPEEGPLANITAKTSFIQKNVETGLFNDTTTEIKSGLKEGDQVVTQSMNFDISQQQRSSSGFRMMGGGGAMRVIH